MKPAPLAWLVALHYLGSVLGAAIILFVLLALTGFVLPGLLEFAGNGTGQVILALVYLAILWCTTWQTVRFLKHRYVISAPEKLLIWSSGTFVLVQVLIWAWAFASIGVIPGLMDLVSTLVSLAVFYLASRKQLV